MSAISVPSLGRELIRRLLRKDAKRRLGCARHGHESDADRIKAHPYCASINWSALASRDATPPFVPGAAVPLSPSVTYHRTDAEEVYAKDVHKYGVDTLARNIKVS